MGNDGGSIPTRRELVKEAARNPTTAEIKESQQEQQEYLWTTDPISQEPLAEPVVSDSSGKLYNKSTILEFLVEASRKEDAERITRGAVKSLKDVVEVRFTGDGEAKGWKCPVTNDKLGAGCKAVYVVPCGHAFSAAAIKEVSGEKCLVCDTAYASNDIIPIIPVVDTDIARLSLRNKILQERGLSHSLKKLSSKKRKKQDGDAEVNFAKDTAAGDRDKAAKINNASTASIAAKVIEDQQGAKKRKTNDNLSRLFASKSSNNLGNNADFMTRGYSVPAGSKR